MNSGSHKKRKSTDAMDFTVQINPKKDRAWYEQESEQAQEKKKGDAGRPRRLSFIGAIGGVLSKMKSSSRMSASSSSLQKMGGGPNGSVSSAGGSQENSFHSTSGKSFASSVDSGPFKRNATLRNFLERNGANDIAPTAAPEDDFSMSNSGGDCDSIGSAASLCTPVRAGGSRFPLDRENELRLSSRSMPAPTPAHGSEATVRRAYSVNESPSTWLRRKSLRLRGRPISEKEGMEELREEDEEGAQQEALAAVSKTPLTSHNLTTYTPSNAEPTPKAIDRSRSAAASYVNKKRFSRKSIESAAASESLTTPTEAFSKGKRLTPSSNSSSTLQRFSGLLKRGFSSGSRNRTPVQATGGASTAEAMVSVQRRPTMDPRRGRTGDMSSRRLSDVTGGYTASGDLSLQFTPTGALDDSRRFPFQSDEQAESFAARVRVASEAETASVVDALADFDAVVVEVDVSGHPGTSFGQLVVERFCLGGKISADLTGARQKKAGLVPVETEGETLKFVIYVVARDTDLCRQIRVGYEAALTAAFQTEGIRKLLLPQLFCSASSLSEAAVGDAIIRTVYKSFVRGEHHLQLDAICIAGATPECSRILAEKLERIVSEKVQNRQQLSGASFIAK